MDMDRMYNYDVAMFDVYKIWWMYMMNVWCMIWWMFDVWYDECLMYGMMVLMVWCFMYELFYILIKSDASAINC